jgi:hypothetical protein
MTTKIEGARVVAIVSLVLAGAIAGCEGDDAAVIESYVDSAGRSCTVDLHDISQTATCDVAPTATCEAGQEPAIVVDDDYDFETMIYTLESCEACVDREERMTYIGFDACANVTCETDDDCLYDRYTCTGGICRDM